MSASCVSCGHSLSNHVRGTGPCECEGCGCKAASLPEFHPNKQQWAALVQSIKTHGCPACKGKGRSMDGGATCVWCNGSGKGTDWLRLMMERNA